MKDTKIIHLYGAPGAGKSTCAAGLFYLMKSLGYNVEMVYEFPKELVYDENWEALKDQDLIFNEQKYRVERLLGTVDYIISDSPIMLGLLYTPKDYNRDGLTYEDIKSQILNWNSQLQATNFYINRVKAYNPIGRTQSEEESNGINDKAKEMIEEYKVAISAEMDGDWYAPHRILNIIQNGSKEVSRTA